MRVRLAALGMGAAIAALALALAAEASAQHSVTTHVSQGGNGAFGAGIAGISANGSTVVFLTDERLVTSDTDATTDLYQWRGGAVSEISGGELLRNNAPPSFLAVSQDGTRVFFSSRDHLTSDDTDGVANDIYEYSGGANALISKGTVGDANQVTFSSITPDGTHVVFVAVGAIVPEDTDGNYKDVYERSGGVTRLVSGGAGSPVPADAEATGGAINRLGDHIIFSTSEQLVPGDTDLREDDYDRSGGVTTLISTAPNWGDSSGVTSQGHLSDDGTSLLVTTNLPLVPEDTDSCFAPSPPGCNDVYEFAGGTTTLVSRGSIDTGGANGSNHAGLGFATADHSRVFFTTKEHLEPADTDSSIDVYVRSGGTTTLVTGGAASDVFMDDASADGSRVFYSTESAPGDPGSRYDIYEHSGGTDTLVSTGPTGGGGGYNANFVDASLDGTRVFFTTAESLVAADTNPAEDLYERVGGVTYLIQTGGAVFSNPSPTVSAPRIDASGSNVAFETPAQLLPTDTDSSKDVYRASLTSFTGYGRPKGANPISVSLALAYVPCSSANRTHAPPLSFGSCNPAQQASPNLTVGTPDANGQPAKAVGTVKITALGGDPATPADEADIGLHVDMADIRTRPALSDYTGTLKVNFTVRLTDRDNPDPGGGSPNATMVDVPFPTATVPCAATPDTTVGASCAVDTTAEAQVPGVVTEGKRAIWSAGQVVVIDGGPDGDVNTLDNSLFMTQGVFVP